MNAYDIRKEMPNRLCTKRATRTSPKCHALCHLMTQISVGVWVGPKLLGVQKCLFFAKNVDLITH